MTSLTRGLNVVALYGLSLVLATAFYYQLLLGELPCPLCALQRVGFIVAGVGLMLNLRSGYSPANYGLVLLTSVAAGAASLRQISLHVIPGSGSYGSALFGLHFYTWAFVAYGALAAFTGLMLMLHVRPPVRERIVGDRFLERMACWLFMILAAGNVVALALECGLGACPDNPVAYLWWPK
ncbi:MAG: disulfide bond formation protein B [Casimicrobiaceae bacterium]